MLKAWEFIKERPILAGFLVFGIGIIIILLFSGGSDAPADNSGTIVYDQNNDALTAALESEKLRANVTTSGINAQSAAVMADISRQSKSDDLAAAIAQAQITSQSETTKFVSTLAAQQEANRINMQLVLGQQATAAQLTLADFQKSIAFKQIDADLQNTANVLNAQQMQLATITQAQAQQTAALILSQDQERARQFVITNNMINAAQNKDNLIAQRDMAKDNYDFLYNNNVLNLIQNT